jgi:hypothetical protein
MGELKAPVRSTLAYEPNSAAITNAAGFFIVAHRTCRVK